jgi:hypothetical protein
MLCSSTKNRQSKDRCSLKAIKGIQFCGKHAKSKTKIIWKPDTLQSDSAVKIQKVWRGWMIRHFLSLAGHSFDRSDCHNEEELVTLEDKGRQHPFNFCSFKENGKRWWFGLDTMFKLLQEQVPTNPYTKEPFSRDTRIRLREVQDIACWYRRLYKYSETTHIKAIILSQILEDQLFETISYTRFEYMSRLSLINFSGRIHHFLENRVNDSPTTLRRKHLFILDSCITKQFMPDVHTDFLLFQLLSTLLFILRTTRNKFPLSFIIFGALQEM